MNAFLQYLVNQGVSQQMLLFILLLPVVVTLVTFARQIIGLKGLGIYAPLLITFVLMLTGLAYGLLLFAMALLAATLLRLILKRFRLLYLPRMSLILVGLSLIILLISWLTISMLSVNIVAIPALAILIIIVLSEIFITAQIERGPKIALILIMETFVLAIAGYFLAIWPWLQNFTLAYPWLIILVVILMNIFLGRWTGLRLFEYQRFREVFRHGEFPAKK